MVEVRHPESAQRFREALTQLNLTQVAFAAEVEMGDRHIRKFASGECAVPKLVWMAIELLRARQQPKRGRAPRKHR